MLRLATCLVIMTGCSTLSSLHTKVPPSEQEKQKQQYEPELQAADQALEAQDFASAEKLYLQFENSHAYNIFTNRARIGHARALLGLGDNQAALAELQGVLQSSLSQKPDQKPDQQSEFVAKSAFYSSLAYQGLGEDVKALAALRDAETWSDALPVEIARAELPARLAIAYNRMGDLKTAKSYFDKAALGVEILYRSDSPQSRKSRASTYAMMGQYATASVTSSAAAVSPEQQTQALEYLQFFSLRAMEENDAVWSKAALVDLETSYRNIWNQIELLNDQHEALSLLVTNMEKLRALGSTENNSYTQEFFQFLDRLEARAKVLLVESEPSLQLTPEARAREGLKRAGKVYSQPVFKAEKKTQKLALPEKKQIPNQDPNVEGQ